MMKRMNKSLTLILLAMALLLSACGEKPVFGVSTNEDNSISITADRPADSADSAEPVASAAAESDMALQPGEHFEGTILLEGMEETVHYEAIRNDVLGFEMGYDYENFVRHSEADRERFISVWDNPDNPEIYLEITRSSDDAETTAMSIVETLSGQYNVYRGEYTLERAGVCIDINAEVDKEGLMSIWELQMIYVIPANDGCFVAWGHYTMESADGWGARFRNMMHTFAVI